MIRVCLESEILPQVKNSTWRSPARPRPSTPCGVGHGAAHLCGTPPRGEGGWVFVLELCKRGLNSPTKLSTNRIFSISFLYKLMLTRTQTPFVSAQLATTSMDCHSHRKSPPVCLGQHFPEYLFPCSATTRMSIPAKAPCFSDCGCESTAGREGLVPVKVRVPEPLENGGCRVVGAREQI